LKLIRKLLIGGLAFTVVVACVVGTACLVKRQVYVAICDAFPVLVDGPVGATVDLDPTDELSGNAYIASQSEPDAGESADGESAGTRIVSDERQLERAQAAIAEGLRDASPEEREIWLSELKDESPEDIRQILSLHRRLSPQSLQAGGRSPQDDRVQPASGEMPPARLLQPLGMASAGGVVPPVRGTDDALNLLDSSIKAVQSAEQVILNNIANANTVGFKRSRALFGDESYRQVAAPGQVDQEGRPTASGLALGAGTRILANQIDLAQGRLRQTQQPLDLAIQGVGYFQIKDGNRFLFARAGAFTVNTNGEIVLASKDRSRLLEPAMTIPPGAVNISISPEGSVSVLQQGATQMTQVGVIHLAHFVNPQGLVARGENLFEHNDATGAPSIITPGQNGIGEIRQGCLEESNVVVADELAELRRMQEQLRTLQQLQREFGGSNGER
jgi:flagellar basal-body rod protein FlgG